MKLVPPGDFISPDLPIEDAGPLLPSGREFHPNPVKAKRNKVADAEAAAPRP